MYLQDIFLTRFHPISADKEVMATNTVSNKTIMCKKSGRETLRLMDQFNNIVSIAFIQ